MYLEDCPQLDTNQAKETVLNFPNHAGSNLHPQGLLLYSGWGLPEWFPYKSVYENDSYIVVELPPQNCTTKLLTKGIIFGAAFALDTGCVWSLQMQCHCYIGTTFVASWSSPQFCLKHSELDTVFLWYDKNLLGETNQGIQEEAEPWYVRYAAGHTDVTFIFNLTDEGQDPKIIKRIKIERIGISLLY